MTDLLPWLQWLTPPTLALAVWAIWGRVELQKQIALLKVKVDHLEQTAKDSPSHADIEKLVGTLKTLTATLEGLEKRFVQQQSQLTRIESFLMNNKDIK
ncbi:MAG: hypothetical protein J4F41_00165 [Alphaproteobacteria bacterium]|nr:hypothetical protein [Alphaproteobacteria bacterium]